MTKQLDSRLRQVMTKQLDSRLRQVMTKQLDSRLRQVMTKQLDSRLRQLMTKQLDSRLRQMMTKQLDSRLRQVMTKQLDSRLMEYAKVLEDDQLITRLSAVDLTAQEAKYHDRCALNLFNEAKARLRKDHGHSELCHSLWHSLAFAELLDYIEDGRGILSVHHSNYLISLCC